MSRVRKVLIGVLLCVMMMGMSVSAAEYTVTDVDTVLWSNALTAVQVDADENAAVALPSMEIGTPVHITGVTSNGYWRVEIDGATYYIVGAGLGDTIVTDEYIRKYYDKPVIVNQKGVTVEIDYTEWNMVKHTFEIAHTVTNNMPYVIDVSIASHGASVFNGYTDDTTTKKSYVFVSGVDKEGKRLVEGVQPGETMSGYARYQVMESLLNKNAIYRFQASYHVEKSENVDLDFIIYKPVTFYDYTTTDVRLESEGTINYGYGFKDVP